MLISGTWLPMCTSPCTDSEILEHLKSEGVVAVRNIKVRRKGVLQQTHTYILTFNTPILRNKIKVLVFMIDPIFFSIILTIQNLNLNLSKAVVLL